MFKNLFTKPRVYLDWAAATPLTKEAVQAMQEVFASGYGNPSAIHAEGQTARRLVEQARATVGSAVQIKPENITFTSGGTEANSIAIVGLIEKLHADGRAYADMEIITTRIEHPSVTNTYRALQKRGVTVAWVDVDEVGQIQKNHLRSLVNEKTVLLSAAYANSEIGTVQPLHHVIKILKTAEATHGTNIFFHLDAAQAPLWLNCQFDTLGADLVALDFAKCGGPKGVGALLRSRRAQVLPVIHGGGQENGLRSGTENVAGIVGGSTAFSAAQQNYKERAESVRSVRDAGLEILLGLDTRVVINGADGDVRIANNINISIPGVDTEYLAVWLDSKGFAVSTKSACAGAGGGESTVVRDVTGDSARAQATLRITLGPDTTVQNLKALANAIKDHLALQSQLTLK